MNVLFICSKNQWRSPTAEHVFASVDDIKTRSAGTSRHARHTLTVKDIAWADLIMVMESRHKDIVQQSFNTQAKKILVLNIPDDFPYMDAQLIALLQETALPRIHKHLAHHQRA